MSLKSTLGWFVALVILVGGGWLFIQKTGLLTSRSEITIAKRDVHAEDPNKKFSIDIEYPEIYGLATTALENKVNKEIRSALDQLALSFRTDAEDLIASLPAGAAESSLDVGYTISYQDAHVLSVRFAISTYSSGAAHPNNFSTTLVYNLSTGSIIPLASVFKPSVAYLGFLAQYTRAALTKKLGESADSATILEGTAPKSENFRNYLVTKEGLLFLFDPYQVAAYAAGPQEVLIPWTDLREQLSTDALFVRFLSR